MPTGMADPWQAVIFRADANMQRPTPGPGDKRSRKITDACFHTEARVQQRFRKPLSSLFFFKANFRIGVNPVTQGNEIVSRVVKSFVGSSLGVHIFSFFFFRLSTRPSSASSVCVWEKRLP